MPVTFHRACTLFKRYLPSKENTAFEKIDESTTRVTITQGPLDPAMHEMSVAGWKSSFNKLNRVLAA